jgi:hypothetical protein
VTVPPPSSGESSIQDMPTFGPPETTRRRG